MRSRRFRTRWFRARLWRLARVGILAAAALLTLGRHAWAFPSSRLVYTRGPGAVHCPDEAALRKAVAKRLGYDPFFPSANRTIVASVVLENEKLKAQAQLVDERGIVQGSREYFSAPNRCDELVYALALSISISIDPANAQPTEPSVVHHVAAADRAEPVSSPDSVTSPVPRAARGLGKAHLPSDGDHEDRRSLTTSREAARPSRSAVEWAIGLDARLFVGMSPDPSLAGAGSLAGRLGRWSALVEAGAEWPSSSVLSTALGPVSVRSSRVWAAWAPCGHWDAVFFCAVVMAGRFSVHRTDTISIGDTETFASSGARTGLQLPLTGPFVLRLQGDLLWALTRTPITSRGDEIWRGPAWSASFAAGVVAHFP